MAFLRLGSKSEAFHREGHSWICTSGLPSDVSINIGEMSFHLHKFPLLSRSGLLSKLIEESSSGDGSSFSLRLNDIPGGAKAFELISKFCYGVKIELTALNVVSIRCAAEYLQMTDDYGDGNLVMQTESFLNEVLGNWADSIRALETCEEVLPYAEELHIVSRCIDSLAMKACADPSLFNWPLPGRVTKRSPENIGLWNGISTATKTQPTGEDWWYEDVSFLSLPLYKRLILAIESRGMRPENIAASVVHYARRYLPLMNRQSSFNDANHVNPGTNISNPSEADQRALLEEIVGLLPNKKGVTSSKFLIKLLRTAMVLHASPSCKENLEKRVGAQLDQALLVDLLIPNMGYSETLYDIDCVQRILDHFMLVEQAAAITTPPCIVEEAQLMNGSDSLTPMTMVATLMDGFLAEVAPDVNFKLPKFEALAATIPDYARPLDDGLYHAIDVYLKAHPWITDLEREQLCRLMNCQKLSLEASTHAAQNERLPLRVIVQVLFFEQLRLRTSISSWFFVSDNLENSQNPDGNIGLLKNDGSYTMNSAQDCATGGQDDVKHRVSELEKECLSMKEELQKLVKTKRSWRNFTRRLGFNKKSHSCCPKGSKPTNLRAPPSSMNRQQNYENIEVVPGSLKVN
ncbi:PREDICTED: BTB/POZ domain-containing protein At5g03250 [Theobroma cacao]|uniref:BTB/POZ domain-containing protein At5g03250 n=1 Tax=Theobroma cacao TaxID=3641 RepID=A0AB32V3H6_THECC|nr:PREDICTED: BTB/POZ domain-containing protein At5g03250 [Theobroma cacao]